MRITGKGFKKTVAGGAIGAVALSTVLAGTAFAGSDATVDYQERFPSGVSGKNDVAIWVGDGKTLFTAGGHGVAERIVTNDEDEFLKAMIPLFEPTTIKATGNVTGASPSKASVTHKDDGSYQVKMSGGGVGGSYTVIFDGYKAEKAANSLADFINRLRDTGMFVHASKDGVDAPAVFHWGQGTGKQGANNFKVTFGDTETTFQVGGQGVSGSYATTDEDEFLRYLVPLFGADQLKAAGNITSGASLSNAKVVDKGDGVYWTVLSGGGIGGAYKVVFSGWKAEDAATSLADLINTLADMGALRNATK